jgi:glutamine synthetase
MAGAESVPGKLGQQELTRLVEAGEIETVLAAFPDFYGRLLGKRFVGRFFVENVAAHGLHACNYLLACDMEMDPVPGYIEDYHILQGTREEPLVGAIVRSLDASGVPMEGSKGEWGPGQQELNVRYSDLLEQADRNVLTKHAAKEIADRQSLAVTFMAKWNEKLAGSSLHQHLSVWDAAGKENLFAGTTPLGPIAGSDLFRWFLGGWMAHAEELAALAAPSVNSYKRFQSASFAPTAIAWSHDNRTSGFRVVGEGPSLRIECRLPGADANPYLGEEFVNHYVHFLRTEQRKFDEAVTDWEKARFFERG